jgi:ubiquinone/menaquinone biosynthesis C-methylase UbiE
MAYLMAGEQTELERLRLQSQVWEPAGERLLARLGDGHGLRALEVGCGAMGWLRILSRWVGATGEVIGTDVQEQMVSTAHALLSEESLANVTLVKDDFFSSSLPEASFDLVHLRFQLAPLGRGPEQVAIACRLAKPGGWVLLEEPDAGSWRENPLAPSAARLRELIVEAFARAGGDFNAGRRLPEYLQDAGIEPSIHAQCVTLKPGHPYSQVAVQLAVSLRPHLLTFIAEAELDRLLAAAQAELAHPTCWGMSWTLVQAWGKTAQQPSTG